MCLYVFLQQNNLVEVKHHTLARSERSGLSDKDLKPNATTRDQLNVRNYYILDINFIIIMNKNEAQARVLGAKCTLRPKPDSLNQQNFSTQGSPGLPCTISLSMAIVCFL